MAKRAKRRGPAAKRAKRRGPAAEADVESYRHEAAKRKNIPTAENQKLVADEDKAIKKLRWKRNPDLDPQLVWRGKDFEADPLEVDAPPIYIQEKIKPQAIIEDLRRQTMERSKDGAPQFDFFHDFNGLPEGWQEDATASYYHDEGNWQNRMILGDSLLVMASLAEREALRGKVQCIYMDPPYGIRFNSNWQPSVKSREVKDSVSGLSRESEVIRAFRDTWLDGIHSYLNYLRDRLIAARELLSESGSIFVQIGNQNVHRVRSLMDEIYGPKNFIAQINFKTADPLVLLRHRFARERRAVEPPQHGQRGKHLMIAAMSLRRMVAIEFEMCRSGRKGGSSGSVTVGYGKLREQRGGTRS